MKARIRILPVLLLAGCNPPAAPVTPGGELSAARATWEAGAPAAYRFDFERHCFCLPAAVAPVTLEVREGRVTRVTSRVTGAAVEGADQVDWYSIEELFALIEQAQREGISPLQVEYAPSGYPRRILLGALAADAGVEYRISNVRP